MIENLRNGKLSNQYEGIFVNLHPRNNYINNRAKAQ